MITLRRSEERGGGNHGWLNTKHSFSFSDYYDPKHMGFRSLRVINEDWVLPGHGFPTHPHRDMEIITYVLEGALEHKDSLGTGSVIRPGDGQRMSAGTGIRHSEANPSREESVHLLQIWIMPDKQGHKPAYEQKEFPTGEKRGKLRLIDRRTARTDRSPSIRMPSSTSRFLEPGDSVDHKLTSGRHAWLQVAKGSIDLNGKRLNQGDGAAISEEEKLQIKGNESAEVCSST